MGKFLKILDMAKGVCHLFRNTPPRLRRAESGVCHLFSEYKSPAERGAFVASSGAT